MHAPQPMSPRGHLQELLAIPESRRTDAQWDEIHELEIKLSSANREQTPEQGARRNTPGTTPVIPSPAAARRVSSRSRNSPRSDPSRISRDAWSSNAVAV